MSDQHTRVTAHRANLDADPPLSTLMTHQLVGIVPDAELGVAWQLMDRCAVRHLPVLDGTRCRGLLHEPDLVRRVAERLLLGEHGALEVVTDLCRPTPELRPTDRRSAAARQMQVAGTDAVLVTEGDRLVGIVTAVDLIRSLAGPLVPPGQDL